MLIGLTVSAQQWKNANPYGLQKQDGNTDSARHVLSTSGQYTYFPTTQMIRNELLKYLKLDGRGSRQTIKGNTGIEGPDFYITSLPATDLSESNFLLVQETSAGQVRRMNTDVFAPSAAGGYVKKSGDTVTGDLKIKGNLIVSKGTESITTSLDTVRSQSGFIPQPFFKSSKGYYVFQPKDNGIAPRFYLTPKGSLTGTTSKFEMFLNDYIGNDINYSGFNIFLNNSLNSINIGANRGGSGSRLRTVIGGDYMGSSLQAASSMIALNVDNTIDFKADKFQIKNSSNTNRWAWSLKNTESGTNTGGDLSLDAYNDAGVYLSDQVTFSRSSGLTKFSRGRVESPGFNTNTAAGAFNFFTFRFDDKSKWSYILSQNAMSGGNVGADLIFQRWDDAEVSLGQALRVFRKTGNLLLGTSQTENEVDKLQVDGNISATKLKITATPLSGISADNLLVRDATGFELKTIPQSTFLLASAVSGSAGFVPRFNTANTIVSGSIQDDGTNVGMGGAPIATVKTYIIPSNAAHTGLLIRGAASQSGNLQSWQNNGGSSLVSISATGTTTLSTLAGTGDRPVFAGSGGDLKIGTIPNQVQNNLTASTTLAPSATAVNTALALKANLTDLTLEKATTGGETSTHVIRVTGQTNTGGTLANSITTYFGGNGNSSGFNYSATGSTDGGLIWLGNNNLTLTAGANTITSRTETGSISGFDFNKRVSVSAALNAGEAVNLGQLSSTANEVILSKSANYTITLADLSNVNTTVVYVDATSGNITITLPSVANATGRKIIVFKTDASANTVTLTGGANINGSATYTVTPQYSSVEIHANGTQYYAK